MATTTTNLGLIEPAGQDRALVANINTNSEKIDAEAGKVRDNFALVQNGDTATQAISKDQLVVWKGVLKKATANIASGATLSGSNLSDDTIAAELAALNSNIANSSNVHNIYDSTNNITCWWIHFGRICLLSINITYSGALSYNVYSNMGVPKPQMDAVINLRDGTDGNLNGLIYIDTNGNLSDWANGTGNLTSGNFYIGMVAFITQEDA